MDVFLNQANSQNQISNENQDPIYVQIASFADVLFLMAQTVSVTSKDDQVLGTTALVKLFCGALFILAALIEANQQQIAPGVITPANRLKVAGTIISIIGSILLVRAFFMEVALKRMGVSFPAANITPTVAGTASLSI